MALSIRNEIVCLAAQLHSQNQSARLLRCIDGENSREKEFFLIGWNENALTVTLMGTENQRGVRSEYKVVVDDDGPTCNCPDSYNACKKYRLVCKHICFLVARVARIFSLSFFNGGRLDATERLKLLKALNDRSLTSRFTDQQAVDPSFVATVDDLREVCPICYDDTPTLERLVKCPTCRHTMHTACISVWLQKSKTCVLCRSDAWKTFKH